MTDVVTLDPADPAGTRCANCGAALHGPFCAACGQAEKPLDPPVRHFIGEFAQELFDLDSRVLRSFRRLLLSPGFRRASTWKAACRGCRLAVSARSVAMFAVLATVGNIVVCGLGLAILKTPRVSSRMGHSASDMLAAVDAARIEWMPRVMFVLVPFVAWLVALASRSKRRYPGICVHAARLRRRLRRPPRPPWAADRSLCRGAGHAHLAVCVVHLRGASPHLRISRGLAAGTPPSSPSGPKR
jgi:hypothetical protein